jgi:glycosyltransferase involved in cell wall biosynthesis
VRVGIDIRVVAPTESGQQRYLWRLGHWLADKGHEVHLLCARTQAGEPPLPHGLQLHRWADQSARHLRARVTALDLDVLLLNPERSRAYRGISANLLRSAYGTEHYRQKLRSFRNPVERGARRILRAMPWEMLERRWERGFYEATGPAPRVIAQSEYMRNEILTSYPVASDRVHVIHNGVDLEEFNPPARDVLRDEMRARWSIPPGAHCLLFMGHNFRLKGLWDLLAAVASSGRATHLLVAGRGTGEGQRRKARRTVARLGLGERVTLAGVVRPSLHALAAADTLVHLSWHDSFGFVALEAMACGLPVVTTPWCGAAELIEDGRSGMIVSPERLNTVTAALRALDDVDLRSRVGAAAAERAARCSEPENFERVLEVMELTASDRTARPKT